MPGEMKSGEYYTNMGKDGGEYIEVGADQISVTQEEQNDMRETYTHVETVAKDIIADLQNISETMSVLEKQTGSLSDFFSVMHRFSKQDSLPTAIFESDDIINERVGDYAGHDFNNVAAGLVGYASLLEVMYGSYKQVSDIPEDDRSKFESMVNKVLELWKMYELVSQAMVVRLLNDYSVEKNVQDVALLEHGMLKQMFDVMESRLDMSSQKITITSADITDEAKELSVFGHEGTLTNASLNLMSNPIDKQRDIEATEFGYEAFVESINGKKHLVQQFTDNGNGMNKDRLQNMFEKKPTEGAYVSQGLGLAYVDNLIRSMGGRITVETVDRESGEVYTFDSDKPEGNRIEQIKDDIDLSQGTRTRVYFPESMHTE